MSKRFSPRAELARDTFYSKIETDIYKEQKYREKKERDKRKPMTKAQFRHMMLKAREG